MKNNIITYTAVLIAVIFVAYLFATLPFPNTKSLSIEESCKNWGTMSKERIGDTIYYKCEAVYSPFK